MYWKQKNISSDLLESFDRQLTRTKKKEKPSTELSIAKEVMPAKREMKKIYPPKNEILNSTTTWACGRKVGLCNA